MIAELGLALLWMATMMAILQFVGAALEMRGRAELSRLIKPAAIVQGGVAAASFLCLIYVFAITDLSVKLVASNSHSAKPMIFKIAGAWGNHEGSMLLWVTVMALSGAIIAFAERRLEDRIIHATLCAQAFVSIGFYAFILKSSNPFERLAKPAAEGVGLNPLLQDIGLAFHPPTLYFGYVGLSVAFSFAVGALLTRSVTPTFARAMRPWVLGAWLFLTIGITAGSYWAYYELGWGGWWFWDPVENASLMPWLAATALLHSVSVLAARDALRTWTVMLGVVAFSMSMLGTFLVRSGVLTSVHAFAVDPERGSVILMLLAINIGAALLVFAMRAKDIAEGTRFTPISREGMLVINNVLLSAILGIVLLGTLYPLVTEAFGVRVSVGPPYFNPVSAAFALPMLVVMIVGPLLRWRGDKLGRYRKPLFVSGALSLVAASVTLALGSTHILANIGLALSLGLGFASLLPLKGRNLVRTPLPIWGMVIAHFGIAVALFGMASETAFSEERLAALKIGESTTVGPWSLTLKDIAPVPGPNWTALEGRLSARYNGGRAIAIAPQSRSFWSPPQETTESALATRWNGQLYVVLGKQVDEALEVTDIRQARWQLRLWWKPFVPFIWYGGLLIAFGGFVALLGRLRTDITRFIAKRKIAERKIDIAERQMKS